MEYKVGTYFPLPLTMVTDFSSSQIGGEIMTRVYEFIANSQRDQGRVVLTRIDKAFPANYCYVLAFENQHGRDKGAEYFVTEQMMALLSRKKIAVKLKQKSKRYLNIPLS